MATLDELLARNPFPGLRAFDPGESDVFFGRDRQIEDLAEKLEHTPLIAVAGDSGCGKSSLVLAGLLHVLAVRGQADSATQWRPVVMRPGSAPVDNLAQPLARALAPDASPDAARGDALAGRLRLGGFGLSEAVRTARLPSQVRLLVVVDQFEEIFRYRRLIDADEAAAFVKLLLHAAIDTSSPVNVILTLRSNKLGQCADFRDLPEAVSRGQFLVPRLTREQRKQAITGPVERRGFRVAPRLVQRVLNDVSDDYDDLPVMQHALSYTWQRWAKDCNGSRDLDLQDYDAAGGARQALSKHADEALDSLPGLEPVVERVFRALTERLTGGGGEDRRPMPMQQLCAVTAADEKDVAAVVERYRRSDTAFVLPGPQKELAATAVIDISHESLIRGWGRLRDWAHDEALSAQSYRRIVDAAVLHAADKEALLRDPALQFALDWRQRSAPHAAWADLYGGSFEPAMAYLDKSRAEHLREQFERERAQRVRRRLWAALLVGSVASAIVMAVLLGHSVQAARDAEKSRQEVLQIVQTLGQTKREVEQRAESRRLALEANQLLGLPRPDSALLLGAAALQVSPAAEEAQEIMRKLLLGAPRWMRRAHTEAVTSLAFSADGQRLLSAARDGGLAIWGAAQGDLIETLDRALAPQRDTPATLAPDSSLLAAPDREGRALVRLAPSTLQPALDGLHVPEFAASATTSPPSVVSALDAQSGWLAAADAGSDVRLWDLRSGRLLKVLRGAARETTRLALAPGGRWLAAAQTGHGVLLWDLASGRTTARTLKVHAVGVRELAFSPDGTRLASAGFDRTLVVWDLARGQPLHRLAAQPASIERLAFDPEGQQLAVGDVDGGVTIWSLTSGVTAGRAERGHSGRVTSLVFSPGGHTLASGGEAGMVVLWDADEATPLRQRLRGHQAQVDQLTFSPDGQALASGSADGAVMLWDLSPQSVRHGVFTPGLDASAAVAFSPDGTLLALASEDSFVWLWDVARGRVRPSRLGGHDRELMAVTFSPDGKLLASGGEDQTVRLWDVASGEAVGPALRSHEARVSTLAFSPDGRWLASAGRDSAVVLWDVARRQPRKLARRHADEVTVVAFSPDGLSLASASRDKSVIVWDVASGQARGNPIRLEAAVSTLAFSPDGQRLVTGSADGRIRFWDPGSGAAQGNDLNHAEVNTVAFDPAGRWLVSGGDGDLRLWDVATRSAIGQPFAGHEGVVWSVSVRADGRTVASAGADRRVVLWDVDLQHWSQRACSIVGREIRPEEWPRGIDPARRVCLP